MIEKISKNDRGKTEIYPLETRNRKVAKPEKLITFVKKRTMEWIEKLDGNVIVSDENGRIIYMNEMALSQYEKDGGKDLIGRDLLECHSEASRKKILEIMTSGERNVYTIEKKGRKKIIYQSPWFVDGKFRGIIELSLVIPAEMPHYIRD